MGCKQAKGPAPQSPSSKGTLLTSGAYGKESVKEASEVPSEPAKVSQGRFEGSWSGGVIHGSFLTWKDGSVSHVQIDETKGVVEVDEAHGASHIGEIGDDDNIHWNDGDVWSRRHVCAGFCEYQGFVCGPDLLVQTLTPEEAICKASTMQNCSGFTYEGGPTDWPVKIFFKSRWNIGGSGWMSYKKEEEVPCSVGDDVMATFLPTGKRYPATIVAIDADNTITVSWLDGCKTHCSMPPSKVFKDAKMSSSPHVEEPSATPIYLGDHTNDLDTAGNMAVLDSGVGGLPTIKESERSLSAASLEGQERKQTEVGTDVAGSISAGAASKDHVAMISQSKSSTLRHEQGPATLPTNLPTNRQAAVGWNAPRKERRERGLCCC